MYFRCTSCLAATWIGSDRPPQASETATCHECGRSYTITPDPALGTTEGSHYRRAAAFAKQERLDIASAYSFLLGMIDRGELTAAEGLEQDEPALTDEELQLFDALEVELPVPTTNDTEPAPTGPPPIDPGFQKAVARGRLSVEEALRRGDRGAYASNLAGRYELTMELAFAVADNRITLFQARKRQQETPRRDPATPLQTAAASGSGRLKRLAILGVVTVAILGLTWTLSRKEPRSRSTATTNQVDDGAERAGSAEASAKNATPDANAAAYSSTRIVTDASGRLTQVVGLDARTVLDAYCGAGKDTAICDPLEILDTVPPTREVRVGTFREADSPHEIHAIRIQRDRFSRRWVAGDGERPIALAEPPQAAPEATR